MFKRLLVLSLAAAGFDAMAASGIWASFVQLTPNGGSPQWYDAQNASGLPDFQGSSLGTFDTTLGNTLVISDGEIDTYKDGSDNVTGANLNWRVWSGSPSGSFNTIVLGFTSNEPYTNPGGVSPSGAAFDQQWSNIASTPNVLQGLSAGTYTLEIYLTAPFTYDTGSGTHFSNNGGANYQATFTVVPEPSTYALAGVGLLAILARRRMAKRA